MSKKIIRGFRTNMALYGLCLIVFVIVTIPFEPLLALAEGVVAVVVLMVGVVANMFLQIPALGLTISAGFVIFSSLLIMFQIRNIIDGGETSHVSAALTIFVSLYNIFSSLLHILTSLFGEE